ncbi:MAG: hypothetical protein NDF54_08085 [archaeon GB-1867-035]|nr:hypothetical protein [Candidatus Culexmicrobium profundum]
MKKRASSTVLGSLLFIIIITSIAFFIFSTALDYQIAIKKYLKRQEKREEEKIEIIEIGKDNGNIQITIRNSGSIDVKIAAIYINHILIKTLEHVYIPAGNERKITLENISLSKGDYIKIATDRGNFATYIVEKEP